MRLDPDFNVMAGVIFEKKPLVETPVWKFEKGPLFHRE
jgi:hypothetical protein